MRHILLVVTTVVFCIGYMSQSAICQNSGAVSKPLASSTKDAMLLPDTVLGLIAVKDTKKLLKFLGRNPSWRPRLERIEKRFEEILNQGVDLRQQLMVVVWDSPQGIVPSMVAKIADLDRFKAAQKAFGQSQASMIRIGDYAVTTQPKVDHQSVQAFLEELTKRSFIAPVRVELSVENLMRRFGAKILKDYIQGAREGIASGVNRDAHEFTLKLGEAAESVLSELSRLELKLDYGKAVRLSVAAVPKPASQLARQFQRIQGAEHRVIERLPAHSLAFFSAAADQKTWQAFSKWAAQMNASVSKMTGKPINSASEKAMEDYFAAWTKASGATWALSVHRYPASGDVRGSMVFGVKDKVALREAARAYADALRAEPPAGMGAPEYNPNAYMVAGEPVAITKADLSTVPMHVRPFVNALAKSHTIFADDIGAVAFGDNAKVELENLVGQKYRGLKAQPGVAYVLNTVAKSSLFIACVRPLAIVEQFFKSRSGASGAEALFRGLNRDNAMGLSIGRSGRKLELVAATPVALLTDVLTLFQRFKSPPLGN